MVSIPLNRRFYHVAPEFMGVKRQESRVQSRDKIPRFAATASGKPPGISPLLALDSRLWTLDSSIRSTADLRVLKLETHRRFPSLLLAPTIVPYDEEHHRHSPDSGV